MESIKVVYIHLKDPAVEQQDYFFGSVKAAYSVLTEEQLGVKYLSLMQAMRVRGSKRYENKKFSLIISELIRNPNKKTE